MRQIGVGLGHIIIGSLSDIAYNRNDMKVCSYTMTSDTGFAPNPFHGYCTLAACTPNHMGAKLVNGDWIAGFFTNTGIPSLVYAMRIDEVLGYNNYYSDIRFKRKKPRISGTPKDRCGDNIYHLDSLGTWLKVIPFF